MSKYCSHGAIPHFSFQSSHLNICYYHQDLQQQPFHPDSNQKIHYWLLHPPTHCSFILIAAVRYQSHAWAPSIFRASPFGRWVVTHSLADFDFHDHRPAVIMNQRRLWYLMTEDLSTLTQGYVHPLLPLLVTRGPTWSCDFCQRFMQVTCGSYPRVWE